MDNERICARGIRLQLCDKDYESGTGVAMLEKLLAQGVLRAGFVDAYTKQIYAHSNTKFNFCKGLDTMCDKYRLTKAGTTRLEVPLPAPKSLLDDMFGVGGYDPERLAKVWGDEMSPEALMKRYSKKCANTLVTAKMNKIVVESTASDIVSKGLVSMGNTVGQVAQSKLVLAKDAAREDMEAKPVCVDPLKLTFRKVDDQTGRFAEGYDPYTVDFIPHPDDTSVKLKHYYIFSKKPSWGKSYVLREKLAKRFRVGRIQSINNACNVLDGVQFLVVDEYSQRRSLDLADLKGLTSGNASDGAINRKSFGDSYVPKNDMQMIILSNQSPYDVYSTYNKKYGCRCIHQDDVDAIHARFFVHMLDGDLETEYNKWLDPSCLTREAALRRSNREVNELVGKYGRHPGTLIDLFENASKVLKVHGLDNLPRDGLLSMLPLEVCGGIPTDKAADVLLEPWSVKTTTHNKAGTKRKLTKLVRDAHETTNPMQDLWGKMTGSTSDRRCFDLRDNIGRVQKELKELMSIDADGDMCPVKVLSKRYPTTFGAMVTEDALFRQAVLCYDDPAGLTETIVRAIRGGNQDNYASPEKQPRLSPKYSKDTSVQFMDD